MALSTRDYNNIAAIIRDNKDLTVPELAEKLATYFEIDNPRFDPEFFLNACETRPA